MKVLIDGYNLIHANEELKTLAEDDLEAAREQLIGELIDYGARRELDIEVVFDGADRVGPASSERRTRNLTVTFTSSGKTADSYIESKAYRGEKGEVGSVLLITGDYHQQKVAAGAGFLRMSPREFLGELRESREEAGNAYRGGRRGSGRVTLDKRLPQDVREALLRMRKRRD